MEVGRERGVGQLEAHLVVALAGRAVGDRVGALGAGDLDLRLAMSGRAIDVPSRYAALVDGVGAQHREDEVADELLAEVVDVDGARRRSASAFSRTGSSSSPWPRSAQKATTSAL